MSVLLLMYLCANATRLDCKVIPVQQWAETDAYEQCIKLSLALTEALTDANRGRHQFVCELQIKDVPDAKKRAHPVLTHDPYRL